MSVNPRISFSKNMEFPKLNLKLIDPDLNRPLQNCMLMGPLNLDDNQVSIVDLLPSFIHIAPIICVDFSMANLTFSSTGTSVHTPNVAKPN